MSDSIYDFRSAKVKDRLMGMDYEELDRHLSEVSDLPDFAQKDGYICLIWEVMEEKNPNPCNFSDEDIRLSWEAFCEKCREEENLTIIDDMPESPPTYASSEKKPKKKTVTRILRGVAIAAAIAALLCVVASAFGYNVFRMFVSWGEGVFRLSPTDSAVEEGEQHAFGDLVEEVNKHTDLPIVPSIAPTGAVIEELTIENTSAGCHINATYRHEEGIILFNFVVYSDPLGVPLSEHQINDDKATRYQTGGNTFYILCNLEQTGIVWHTENVGCYIWGDFSEEEAKRMVDSIYEE